jgi:hypothetical protein
MVALLGFLEPLQVLVELLLREERRAVHALHRLVLRVALPVRVRGGRQLERLELARRRHVRADAEVDERVAVLDRVAGDVALTGGLLLDQLHLERLAALREERERFVARPDLPLEDVVGRRHLAHACLDRLEVLGHERARHDEVVEEALVDRRTDAALHVGEERRHRRRQQVRRRVAIELQRFGRLVGDDADPRVLGQRERQIDHAIVDERRKRRFGETGRDVGRDGGDGSARRHLSARAVGKRDRDLRHERLAGVSRGPSALRLSSLAQGIRLAEWPAMSERVAGRRPAPSESNGRHGQTRTADLLRVKQAL